MINLIYEIYKLAYVLTYSIFKDRSKGGVSTLFKNNIKMTAEFDSYRTKCLIPMSFYHDFRGDPSKM